LERTQPPLEKLPWERPDEEIDTIVRSEVADHFAKKVPEIPFEKTLDPVKVVRTVENLYDPQPSPPSDYRRSIERSYDEMVGVKKRGTGGPGGKRETGGPVKKKETSSPARRTTRSIGPPSQGV
jgi:hypothetical protein